MPVMRRRASSGATTIVPRGARRPVGHRLVTLMRALLVKGEQGFAMALIPMLENIIYLVRSDLLDLEEGY